MLVPGSRPLLQGLGALSQAQVAVRPHRLACARCGQAVPAVAVYEGKVTPDLLAFAAVLLSSWRCAAAAPATALF